MGKQDGTIPRPAADPKSAAPATLATERIMGIFQCLSSGLAGKSLTELSQQLDAPKSSLLNLLPGLIAMGYLVRSGRKYALGTKAFDLAAAITRTNLDIAGVSKPLLCKLAQDTGKTVTLCVLDQDERAILHIAKEESSNAMRFAVEVGARAPVHATAGGHVILAFKPGDWYEDYMAHAQLQAASKHTLTDRAALRAAVQRTREQGYGVTLGDMYESVGAIGAPVFSMNGFVCAVTAAGAVEQVRAKQDKLAHLVMQTASEISALIS